MNMSIVRNLYGAATFAASLPVFPILLLRRRSRERLGERYGGWNLKLSDCLWFHGASVGEVNGLLPVIKRVHELSPQLPLLMSAMTVTGLERARPQVAHTRLLPLDVPIWIRRALGGVQPRALDFSETELWPCLVEYLAQRTVPMFLVNARISDYSFDRYKRMRGLLSPLLTKLNAILVSSQQAAERFTSLGADPARIEVTGNAKYDVKPALSAADDILRLRRRFFADDQPLLVLGSLRPDEEKIWFPLIKKAQQELGSLQVVVAPRHKEKFDYFGQALQSLGIAFRRWSGEKDGGGPAQPNAASVVLLDTMGDLNAVYALADVAFVGGTLVNIGGHNPLEPAAYGACVALGPSTANVADVVVALREKDALISVSDDDSVWKLLQRLALRDAALKQIGQRGQEVWRTFTGATERIVQCLEPILRKSVP